MLLPCDVGRDPNRSTFEPKQPPLELRRVPPLPASWCARGSPLPSGSASCCLLQAEHADHGRRCGSFGRSTHRSINGGSHRRLPRRMNGHRPPTGPEKLRAPCAARRQGTAATPGSQRGKRGDDSAPCRARTGQCRLGARCREPGLMLPVRASCGPRKPFGVVRSPASHAGPLGMCPE